MKVTNWQSPQRPVGLKPPQAQFRPSEPKDGYSPKQPIPPRSNWVHYAAMTGGGVVGATAGGIAGGMGATELFMHTSFHTDPVSSLGLLAGSVIMLGFGGALGGAVGGAWVAGRLVPKSTD
jgi:hypothetical protein